nr:Hint domain-containing protein [Amylibacter sp.]
MSANQHTYTIAANTTPFSVIKGGFANFSTNNCITGEKIKHETKTQITWILRDRFTNQVFKARQDVSSNHAALYAELVCELPLVDNHVYETISVSTQHTNSPPVKGATSPQAKAENRLGVARGTHVMTNRGEVPVEKLRVGDRVITRDRGLQEIRWIGSQKVNVTPDNAPILFRKGAIKNARDLIVSADQRVVLKGAEAMALYGVKEVLIPARMLVDNIAIIQAVGGVMEFYQILTDRHEVIYTEAAASESFMPTPQNLELLVKENRAEILTTFPALASSPEAYGPCARGFVEA